MLSCECIQTGCVYTASVMECINERINNKTNLKRNINMSKKKALLSCPDMLQLQFRRISKQVSDKLNESGLGPFPPHLD